MESIWHHHQSTPNTLCLATQDGQNFSRTDIVQCITYDTYRLNRIIGPKDEGIILLVDNSPCWLTLGIAALQLGIHVIVADRTISSEALAKLAKITGINCIFSNKNKELQIEGTTASIPALRFYKAWKFKKRIQVERNNFTRDLPKVSGRLLSASKILRGTRTSMIQLNIDRHGCASIFVGMLLTKGILPDSGNIQVVHHKLSRPELFAWALGTIHSGNILILLDVSSKDFSESYKKLYTAYINNNSSTRIGFNDPVR